MSDAASLSNRIKAEFDAQSQRKKTVEDDRAKQSQELDARLAKFTKVCDDLKGVWGPRLEEFAKQFGDKIKVTPTINPSQRQAKVDFHTDLANVTLTLNASASSDASTLVLDYDLLIIPMMFEYERNSRLEMPLDKIDKNAIGKWVDDQLVSCVKSYLAMQENEFYTKHAMVEDPISNAKFLKDDAAAKLQHGSRTFYFASEDTLKQYKQKHQITA